LIDFSVVVYFTLNSKDNCAVFTMSSEEEEYVFYKDRLQWKDVVPIKQDDGEAPVCPIAYTAEFEDVMNYFRAMLQADEKSQRALENTTEVIEFNAANYTVWYFRRLILKELNSDLKEELQFVSDEAAEHPKNYQIWYHRRAIVEMLGDSSQELQFTKLVHMNDAKNYHAWDHRQWVLKTFKLWDGELEYVEKLLRQDVRNNSAWNQRYFVITNTTDMSLEVCKKESLWTIERVKEAPNNESAWNYLRGIMKGYKFTDFPEVVALCEECPNKWPACAFGQSLLVDVLTSQNKLAEAKEVCERLARGVDDIHKKYWEYRTAVLDNKITAQS